VGTVIFAVATIYLFAYAAMRAGAFGPSLGDQGPASLNAATYLPLALLSIAACLHASRYESLDPGTRRAWRFFAATFAFESLQMVTQVVGALLGSRPMVDTRAQVISLSIDALRYVCTFGAILAFPKAIRRGADRTTFGLDTLTVGASAAVLAWHLNLRALVVETHATVWQSVFTLAYPIATLSAAFGFAVLVMRRPSPRSASAVRLIAFAFFVNVVTDAIYMRLLAKGGSATSGVIFIVYGVIEWMTLTAAYLQSRAAARAVPLAEPELAPTERSEAQATSDVSRLPYLAIAALFGVLLWESSQPPLREAFVLVLGAIVVTLIVTARQLGAQKKNRELVAERLEREAHFRALVQHGSEVILVLDAEGGIREVSPAITRVLGYAPSAVVGHHLTEFVSEEDIPLARADLAQVIAMPALPNADFGTTACEWRLRHANGGTRWLEILSTNMLSDRAVQGVVLNGRDVSERKALESELTHRAFHDPLTGLVNRARFTSTVQSALARIPSEAPDRPGLAVLYVDLDDFKPINDRFGHSAGDHVLIAIAARLRDATRGSDTVARLGGDEFGLLLERVRGSDEVAIVAERLVRAMSQPIEIGPNEVTVGASIGVAYVDLAGGLPSTDALLQAADSAMYTAKAKGGRQYVAAA
jgi:diguanylate cyclase (GGDEF)-like protein/PAS domain S-box-containing protein